MTIRDIGWKGETTNEPISAYRHWAQRGASRAARRWPAQVSRSRAGAEEAVATSRSGPHWQTTTKTKTDNIECKTDKTNQSKEVKNERKCVEMLDWGGRVSIPRTLVAATRRAQSARAHARTARRASSAAEGNDRAGTSWHCEQGNNNS